MDIVFDTWFKKKYQEGLARTNRFDTMYIALDYLLKKGGHCLVETGAMRMADNWDDGKSTLVLGSYCKKYNSRLYTVDIDGDAIKTCRIATLDFEHCIDYMVGDSVLFLKNFSSKIDFLYLDSMDCPEQDVETSPALIASQQHQLMEIQAAFDKLSEKAVVVLDDNDFENGGKTKLSKLFLEEMGWTETLSWKQSLWMKK